MQQNQRKRNERKLYSRKSHKSQVNYEKYTNVEKIRTLST